MFQSENVFLIRLQRMLNSVEYFPRQFGLDKPRSVNTCGPTPFPDAEFQQKNKIQRKTLRTISSFFQFLNFPYRLQSGDWWRWQSGREEPPRTPHTWTCRWWWGPRSSGRSSSPCSCTPDKLLRVTHKLSLVKIWVKKSQWGIILADMFYWLTLNYREKINDWMHRDYSYPEQLN